MDASGPATCAYIATGLGQSHYCNDCEHHNQIKSPVVLGLAKKKSRSPADQPRAETTTTVHHIDLLAKHFAATHSGS
jgi:hypothetical protein